MTTELSPPKGHGLVRVAHNLRVHAYRPQDWGAFPATDYWANWGDLTFADAAASDLVANGWFTSGFTHTVGSAASFLTSTDVGITGGLNFGTADDYCVSPAIFGDYTHQLLVGQILGYLPTRLNMEVYARFVAGNNEEATGFGWLEDGALAAVITKANEMAYISTDGTTFSLESGAAVAVSDTAEDTVAHQWKIQCEGTAATLWIDGVQQTNTLALQDDQWPARWGAGTTTGGANDPVVAWVHIWYE